jgi:poly(3-hydroxybutyrate) depolymerase
MDFRTVFARMSLVMVVTILATSCQTSGTRSRRSPPEAAHSGDPKKPSVKTPVAGAPSSPDVQSVLPRPEEQTPQQSTVGGSPGCQKASDETGLKNVSIKVGRGQRTFIRVVNTNYSNKAKHALVIGYHGLGLDGTSPRKDHKWTIIEETAGDQAIFIYANAAGGAWDASESSGDVDFFDEIVSTTGDAFCIDVTRVFVHGFSNGAFFVNSLVAQRQNAIRGVISVAGGGSGTKLPAMIIHGQADPNVGFYSYAPSLLKSYAGVNGCRLPIDIAAKPLGQCQPLDGCPASLQTIFCPWDGNHHWPEFTLPDVWKFISSLK